jgi:hypothetical protein
MTGCVPLKPFANFPGYDSQIFDVVSENLTERLQRVLLLLNERLNNRNIVRVQLNPRPVRLGNLLLSPGFRL